MEARDSAHSYARNSFHYDEDLCELKQSKVRDVKTVVGREASSFMRNVGVSTSFAAKSSGGKSDLVSYSRFGAKKINSPGIKSVQKALEPLIPAKHGAISDNPRCGASRQSGP
ncbi:hypothetical protein CRG98_017065 [Punica granatum]|uniref:Uncharacterized protein n=1 Tax=Punica granatum TaxID=22663 RepID=A0A2I0K1W5_PUNGR|nr:hypothetical protein CRG98_017065 [Punica granatum]